MGMQRYFDLKNISENFPVVTFIIAMACLVIFLFTYKDIIFYENLLGFTPASPRIYSIVTYSFLHANMSHLIGNLIMLILLGIILENYLDPASYVLIYLTSGVVAALFDMFTRGILGISGSLPFIGASGAIFGLAGVAMLVRPYEKLPSFLVILFVIPLILLVIDNPGIISNPFVMLLVLMFVGLLAALVMFSFPSLPTLGAFFFYAIFTILFIFIKGFTENVSYIGHLGGLFGGLLSFFIFCRKSEKEK